MACRPRKRPVSGALSPRAHPCRSDGDFAGVIPAGVTIQVTSGSRAGLTADLRALGIPRLDAQDALTGKRPEIPLDELTSGRAERLCLLALMER